MKLRFQWVMPCLYRTLKHLDLRYEFSITSRGWEAFSLGSRNPNSQLESLNLHGCRIITALCSKESIASTFSSNHTIKMVTDYWGNNVAPDYIQSSLDINMNNNKVEVARQKILKHHFSGENDNIHVFTTRLRIEVLPHAISWIGRDGLGFMLMYHAMQALPTLFESAVSFHLAGRKRKLGSC